MTRNKLQPNNRSNQSREKKDSPERSWFFEYKNSDQNSSNRANTCPDGVGSTNWQNLCGFVQQQHAYRKTNKKTNHPIGRNNSCSFFGFAQTRSKTYFKKSCDDQ